MKKNKESIDKKIDGKRCSCRLTHLLIHSNYDHTPSYLRLGLCFLGSKRSVPAKTKGQSRGRLHSDAQVNTGAKKQNVSVIVLVTKNCVPCGFS